MPSPRKLAAGAPPNWAARLNEDLDQIEAKAEAALEAAGGTDPKIPMAQKGAPSGVAPLDSTGKLAEAYLPSDLPSAEDIPDMVVDAITNDTTVQDSIETASAVRINDTLALPSYVTSRARVNPFDAVRGVYNWKPSNTRRLRAGLGRAARGGVAEHVVVGDSFSAGCVYGLPGAQPLVFDRAGAWPMILRDRLDALGIPSGGSGWIRCNDNLLGFPIGWAFAGVWNLVQKFLAFTQANGATATLTVPAEYAGATAYSHLWYDPGTGGTNFPFTISVDGAVAGAGFRAVNADLAQAGWRVTTLLLDAPLAAGDTIVITSTSVQGHYFVAGKLWNPDAGGLQVHNLAQSGSRAYSTAAGQNDRWASVGTNALGSLLSPVLPNGTTAWTTRTVNDAVLTAGDTTMTSASGAFTSDDLGKTISTPAGANGLRLPVNENVHIVAVTSATEVELSAPALLSASGVTVTIGRAPDCLHIELGGNDLSNAATNANIAAAITTIRGFLPNSDCILYVIPQPSSSLIPFATFDAWVASMYDLADTLDVPLVDLRARFGTYADMVASGLLGDSTTHPRPEVYAETGLAVASLLSA